MNLFVGVVINTFNTEKEKLGKNHLLTDEQNEWVQTQILCFKARPLKLIKMTRDGIRNVCIKISESTWFDYIIMFFIILNTVILAIKWFEEPNMVPRVFEVINYVFAIIFTIECMIKVNAYRMNYFSDGWNVFDFIIVVGTILGIILSNTTKISVGP